MKTSQKLAERLQQKPGVVYPLQDSPLLPARPATVVLRASPLCLSRPAEPEERSAPRGAPTHSRMHGWLMVAGWGMARPLKREFYFFFSHELLYVYLLPGVTKGWCLVPVGVDYGHP